MSVHSKTKHPPVIFPTVNLNSALSTVLTPQTRVQIKHSAMLPCVTSQPLIPFPEYTCMGVLYVRMPAPHTEPCTYYYYCGIRWSKVAVAHIFLEDCTHSTTTRWRAWCGLPYDGVEAPRLVSYKNAPKKVPQVFSSSLKTSNESWSFSPQGK